MEIKVGIVHSSREITIDAKAEADELNARIDAAITEGAPLELEDGSRRVVIPAASIAYVDLGPSKQGRVGFGLG